MKVYQAIARKLQAIRNCEKSGNLEWFDKHGTGLARIMDTAPSGSGFDVPMTLNIAKSTPNKLVFEFEYHHLNNGYYTHWSQHKVRVTPSLAFGFDVSCTRSSASPEDMEYFYDTLQYWLDGEYTE